MPDVKWYKDGEELRSSEEYQIENFEDGTSVLFINNVYEDDTGEITFEAHNPLGVAVTTTELSVEGILSYSMARSRNFIFLSFFLYNFFFDLFSLFNQQY